MDNIETARKDKKYLEEHPEEADQEEVSYLDDDIAMWEEKLENMRAGWKTEIPDMNKELELIQKWIKEKSNLLNGE